MLRTQVWGWGDWEMGVGVGGGRSRRVVAPQILGLPTFDSAFLSFHSPSYLFLVSGSLELRQFQSEPREKCRGILLSCERCTRLSLKEVQEPVQDTECTEGSEIAPRAAESVFTSFVGTWQAQSAAAVSQTRDTGVNPGAPF